MSMTREDAAGLYALLMGGKPAPEATLDALLAQNDNPDSLRDAIFRSEAFGRYYASLNSDLRNAGQDLAVEKLVFMHIPKTGGTSITSILDRHYPRGQIFPDQLRLRAYPVGFLARFRLYRGHMPLRELQLIPGAKFIFTMLREPRARILSQYRYHKSRRLDDARLGPIVERAKLPLKEYLRDPFVRQNAALDNLQTRYLFHLVPDTVRRLGLDPNGLKGFRFDDHRHTILEIAKDNLSQLGCFGLLEQFDASVAMLCGLRGLPLPEQAEKRMVTDQLATEAPTIYAPVATEEHDAEIDDLLHDLVALDEALYRFAAELFRQRLAAYDARNAEAESRAA